LVKNKGKSVAGPSGLRKKTVIDLTDDMVIDLTDDTVIDLTSDTPTKPRKSGAKKAWAPSNVVIDLTSDSE
jgi:hypothetical protein